MLPALQPKRPTVNPPQKPQPGYAEQQKRSITDQSLPAAPPPPHNHTAHGSSTSQLQRRPRNQLEAMPPFGPPQAPLMPPRALYDSAVRHPVFFSEQLRKPPFPIPQMGSHGFSPIASGYIVESKKPEGNGTVRTKL